MTVFKTENGYNGVTIERAIANGNFCKEVGFNDSLDSTQFHCNDLAEKGRAEGLLIVADHQFAGRGRGNHQWESPKGVNIYFSFLFKPPWPIERGNELQFICSLAAAEVLKNECNLQPNLKWPNDIRIGDRKLGGLILTSHPKTNTPDLLEFVIMGMGLNINAEPHDFTDSIRNESTSVFIESGKKVDRNEFLAKLLEAIQPLYQTCKAAGFSTVQKAWQNYAPEMCNDHPITIYDVMISGQKGTQKKVSGKAAGIDAQGHLLIKDANGTVQTVFDGTFNP